MGWHTNRLLAGIGKTSFDGSAELKQSSRAPGITGITVTVHSIAAARMICYRGTVSRLARLVVPGDYCDSGFYCADYGITGITGLR